MLTLEKEIKKFHHNLDFSQLLEEKGLRWVRGGGKTCNKILNDIFKKQKHWKDGKNEWTEISQLGGFSIKKGSDIRRYTGILQEKEIIEISRYKLYGSYGTKCYSYKFDDDFYKNELQSIRNKKCILQKRTSSKPKESNNKIEDGELHKIIKKNSEKLIIDFERLEREVDQGNGELMSEISDTFGKFVKEEGHHIYDDVNGRMYSPWIETTREYRKFITHKEGKTLVDLDITSSHPTILSSLYPKFDYVKSKADKKAAKEAWTRWDEYRDRKHGGDGKAPQTHLPDVELERRKYRRKLKLDIYSFFQREVNTRIKHKKYERDDIKRMLSAFLNSSSWLEEETLSHLNFRTKHNKINEVGKAFIREFPCLFELMKIAATKDQSEILSKKGEPCIGIGLMKMESKLMRPVFEDLAKMNLFFIPCHDGVLVEEDAVEVTKDKILTSISKILSIKADPSMVKVKNT